MKKRLLSLLLALVTILGMLPTVTLAAGSEEEALGSINIYNGGSEFSYLAINGQVKSQKYTYYNYVSSTGEVKEIPAYCINPTEYGVPQTVAEGESIAYIASERVSDPKVMGIIANGYPSRSLSELGLDNKYQAYYATKMALWCYLLSNWDINDLTVNPTLTGDELIRANKMLAAANQIYRNGTAWTEAASPSITCTPDQQTAYAVTIDGREYLQQIFTFWSKTWVNNSTVEIAFTDPDSVPAGTRIVNMDNQDASAISTSSTGDGYGGQFKILYPAESVEGQSGSVQLSFSADVYQYAVFYASCAETDKYGNIQNYVVDTDPTTTKRLSAYSSYTSDETVPEAPDGSEEPSGTDSKATGLRILKYETGTTTPLEGAMFEVVDPEGATVGTFSTDRNGEIKIPLTMVGNYTVIEREAPAFHLICDEPVQNVTVVYGETAEVVFENDAYGNLRVEKVSGSGENLPGAVITVQHIESGQTYTATTNTAGAAMFTELKPGGYRIQETAAPAGYILNDTVYTTNVSAGETSVISIVNEEKPGLRITKYDSKNMEALTDITFEIFRDSVSIGKYKTNQLGEILLTNLEPGTYLVQEVASDSTHIVNSTPQQIELSGDDGILELIFLNDQKPGIHLVKLDATSLRPLPNATFRIEQIGGTFSKEYVTDENGEIDLTSLEPGAYTITELEAPDGYLIDGAVRTIQINGNENAQFVFTNTRKPSLRVVKLDSATSEVLPGATFRIAKIEDGSHYLDRITDSSGEINISDLEPGVYSVVEMDAPDGYVKDAREYHVELFPGKVSELVVSNDQMPDLEILKTDATTGAPVPGVTFTVKKVDSSTLTTATTDKNGRCWIENLDPGVYEVWEQSVPDGYLLNEEHQLITLVPNRIGTVQFQNYPKPTLTIHKIDLNGKALTGAIFEVCTKAGVKIGDFPVDETGSVTISNIQLAEGYYIITEIQAPEGYILDETPHEVYLRPGRTTEVSIENEKKPDLMIEKIDSVVGDGIQGAKFEIWVSKDKSEDGTYQKLDSNYYYTDENGHILLDNLDTGWYKIVEVEPPSGYVLKAPSEQTVYIDNDSSATVTFENIPKSALIIRKVGADTGIGLPNAWFRVRYLGGTSGSGGTIIGEYATSNNGNIILTGLDAGTYIVEEISAPDGYVIDTAAQTAYISGLDQDCITLTFTDSANGSLLIKKVDSVTGEPLSDVQFFVTDSDGSVVGTANGYYTTDSAGTILINDIEPGTSLVVKETRAKSGYMLDDAPQTIKIQSGQVVTLEFRNQPLGGLIIHKLDSVTKEPLEGVQFKITYADGSYVDAEGGQLSNNGLYRTNAEGQITLSGLTGTVVVTEVESIPGYVIDPDTQSQTVVINPNDTQTLTFYNTPSTTLVIEKYIEGTTTPLEGVTFLVTDSSGAMVGQSNGEYITDAAGRIVIEGLEPGTTVIAREVKTLEGFVLDGAPKSILIKEGEVQTLRFYNSRQGTLVVRKLDSVTKEPLAGVEFELTYAEGGYVDDANGHLSSKGLYTTDDNGEIRISGITGTIVVKETKTIDGYTIDPATQTQTVIVNPEDTQTLTFYNQPIGGVEIIKVNASKTSERIPNVTFEIRKIDDEWIDTVTTDKNGRVFVSLEAGVYYAVEIEAAEGYRLDDTPHYFEVENGKTTTLRVENEPFSGIIIHKIDSVTGEGIYDVKFLVYDSNKNPVGEYATDQNGYIYIDDVIAEGNGRFYIREIEAAEGYELDKEYKTIYVQPGKTVEIEWENVPITGQIQIYKYAAEYNEVTGTPAGTPLAGAVYEISNARTGKVVDYITTDDRGVAASKPLPLTRYKIVEVTAPAYWQVDSTVHDVTLEYAGQIIKLSAYDEPSNLGVTITKRGNAEVLAGQTMRYDITVANTSNVPLESFFWHDRIPTDAAAATVLTTGTYSARLNYRVLYKTNYTADYQVLASNLLTSNNYSFALNAIPTQAGETVTDIYFDFGKVPVGFQSVTGPTLTVQISGSAVDGYQLVNRADTGGKYQGTWQTAQASWVTIIRRCTTTPILPKTGY